MLKYGWLISSAMTIAILCNITAMAQPAHPMKSYINSDTAIISITSGSQSQTNTRIPMRSRLIGKWQSTTPFIDDVTSITGDFTNMTTESQRIANSYIVERDKVNFGFTSASLTFRKNGAMEYAYEIKSQGRTQHVTGSFLEYYSQPGSNRRFKSVLLLKNSGDGRVIPLLQVNIAADNRFRWNEEILKFRDLDDKEYWFKRVGDETGEGASPWEVRPFVSYDKDDPEYKILHQDIVSNPSPKDLWTLSHLVGRWTINANFVSISLTFNPDGSVDLYYSSPNGKVKLKRHGKYNFLPRENLSKNAVDNGNTEAQETRPHVEIVLPQGGRVIPLFNISITKDDPSNPSREVLKIHPLSGIEYPFVRDISDKSLVPDTRAVDETYAAYLKQLDLTNVQAASNKMAQARSLVERLRHKEIQEHERIQIIAKLLRLTD